MLCCPSPHRREPEEEPTQPHTKMRSLFSPLKALHTIGHNHPGANQGSGSCPRHVDWSGLPNQWATTESQLPASYMAPLSGKFVVLAFEQIMSFLGGVQSQCVLGLLNVVMLPCPEMQCKCNVTHKNRNCSYSTFLFLLSKSTRSQVLKCCSGEKQNSAFNRVNALNPAQAVW